MIYYFWRVKVDGKVFKLYISGGYTLLEVKKVYQGAEVAPITERDYLRG